MRLQLTKILIVLLTLLFNPILFGQNLYNPDLIKELKVKTVTTIKSGSTNDTLISRYDITGRLIYKKSIKNGVKYIDSVFYNKNEETVKEYTLDNQLKSIEKYYRNKKEVIVSHERIQYLPKPYRSGYELIYKKGKHVSTKYMNNGEIIFVTESTATNKSDSIIFFKNDTTYYYVANHDEIVSFYDSYDEKKELGDLFFDNLGRIVFSINYVNNKPNEVLVYSRIYDVEAKTYTEYIDQELYFENGLLKRVEDNQVGFVLQFEYEFYE